MGDPKLEVAVHYNAQGSAANKKQLACPSLSLPLHAAYERLTVEALQ